METRHPDDEKVDAAPAPSRPIGSQGGGRTPSRPTGKDGIRRAVLRSARRLVAARGPRVPLRDIAESAGVNLGLIHRHIGRKDELLSEVLGEGLRHGSEQIDHLDDAGDALRAMLLGATERPDYSRLLLWLALDPDAVPRPEISPSSRPANTVRRMRDRPPVDDEHLALALTVVYAWPVLRSEVLDVLEIPADERRAVDERVADLLAGFVTGGRPEQDAQSGPTKQGGRGE